MDNLPVFFLTSTKSFDFIFAVISVRCPFPLRGEQLTGFFFGVNQIFRFIFAVVFHRSSLSVAGRAP